MHSRPDNPLAAQVKPVPGVPSDELEGIAVPWINFHALLATHVSSQFLHGCLDVTTY